MLTQGYIDRALINLALRSILLSQVQIIVKSFHEYIQFQKT